MVKKHDTYTDGAVRIARRLGAKLTDWSKDKPPKIGVYNASLSRNDNFFRHWNGKRWSVSGFTPQEALGKRRYPALPIDQNRIEWRGLDRKLD